MTHAYNCESGGKSMVIGQTCVTSIKALIATSGPLRSHDPDESSDPNGGNVCLFLAATCTSQCKLRSLRANPL